MSAKAQGFQWRVRTDAGATFTADALVLTAPVPQSLVLLETGGAEFPSEARASLEAIRYDPCIALMAQPKESRLPKPGGMHLSGDPITWIGDNRQKGISSCEAVTLHAGAEFSRAQWDAEDPEIVSMLLAAAAGWITEPVSDVHIHRWRYARPTVLYPKPCLALTEPLPLVFAGDAFGAPRVEGAALSGLAAAEAVLDAFGGRHNL